ncbi:MAG: glycoside hydrolase family 15 protein [Bacteroidota bacterium]|nr:glycoside hydrolase family 15 protein [Bacteroidota bacterium]
MENKYAPGAPGIKPKWTSSAKSGIGKALNTASLVTFSLSHGIVNEVYFPREDIACIRDMELLITDGPDFFCEEKRDCEHDTKMMKPGIPAYTIINTCHQKKFEITKEVIADPFRNTILQKVNFKVKKKATDKYRLYVLLAPHLNDHGENNSGWIGDYKGVPMLYAHSDDLYLALACTAKWLKRSVGYVGHSDGWTDLQQHKEMTWEYTRADNGNIALMAEIDVSENTEFIVALSFGRNQNEASNHSRSSLLDGFGSLKEKYIEGWEKWIGSLSHLSSKNYKVSATVMRMHEARTFPGGIIASLSIPWGETKGDADKGGYHVVWPRDLVESAGGFLALKANHDTVRILNYLMSTQKEDGSWPQNMWLEGTPHWTGLQIDQTAFPILIVDQCNRGRAIENDRMKRYWPGIKKAISFLIKNGPYTKQDRWEEQEGYSPFTIAVSIAGLLSGADLAELNNEKELATYCRETADFWNANVEKWTYVTGTDLAKKYDVDGYYIRINPYHHIDANDLGDKEIDLKNHDNGNGNTKLAELVSVDALALVRFGLRAADDPKILNTIKVIDAMLKVETPNGSCWHRYNNDGYGEHENGDAYDGTGIGRAWPLLTGERAHYEVAAGNIAEAKKLLKAMDAFSNNGFLSEQIWDTEDIPEKELFFGSHSGSAMPLTWAHAEYIKLCASIRDKKIFDMPPQTQERYIKQATPSNFQLWHFNHKIKKVYPQKTLRIQTPAQATVHWTNDAWETKNILETKDPGAGIFVADIKNENEAATKIEFTFYWNEADKWENENYVLEIERS